MTTENTRVAVISIIAEDTDKVEQINAALHEYRDFIIGRMGVPYRQKNIFLISVAIDAPQDKISALGGRLGRIDGVTAKTAFASAPTR